MDDYVDAIIRVKVPKWQIGEEVSIYFPDTMTIQGKCETLDECTIQEVLNKRCMTVITNEYFIELLRNRLRGEWKVKALSTFPQYQPDEYICPFCNTVVNYKTNFCHNCGADMRGAK